MTPTDALKVALAAGVRIMLDGDDLALEADAPPASELLAALASHKAGIVALLRAPHAQSYAVSPLLGEAGHRLLAAIIDAWPGSMINPVPIRWAPPPASINGSRLPSWSDQADAPRRGDRCSCCKGAVFWTERTNPRGWCCRVCHPPDHLADAAVQEVRT